MSPEQPPLPCLLVAPPTAPLPGTGVAALLHREGSRDTPTVGGGCVCEVVPPRTVMYEHTLMSLSSHTWGELASHKRSSTHHSQFSRLGIQCAF